MTVPFGRAFAMVCRGGPRPSRGRLRRRGAPGTISGLRAGPCGPVGLRNAPAGAVRASSPTEVCYNAGTAVSRLAMGPPLVVGEGFIPPAGVCGGAGCGGMRASRPTAAWMVAAIPFGWAFAMVCRGGMPLPQALRCGGVPGPIWNRPLQRFAARRGAFSRLAAGLPVVVGEGFIPPAGVRAAARSAGRSPA